MAKFIKASELRDRLNASQHKAAMELRDLVSKALHAWDGGMINVPIPSSVGSAVVDIVLKDLQTAGYMAAYQDTQFDGRFLTIEVPK